MHFRPTPSVVVVPVLTTLLSAAPLGCSPPVNRVTLATRPGEITSKELVRASPKEHAVRADLGLSAGEVTAELRFNKACVIETTTTERTVLATERKYPTWLAASQMAFGIGLAGLGVAGIATSDGISTSREAQEVGTAIGALGGGIYVTAVSAYYLGKEPEITEEKVVSKETRARGMEQVVCGAAQQLAGLELELRAPGITAVRATVDAVGKARFTLPAGASPGGGAQARVVVTGIPPVLQQRIVRGAVIGTIDLPGPAPAEAPPQP